jgi:hypothetical protein
VKVLWSLGLAWLLCVAAPVGATQNAPQCPPAAQPFTPELFQTAAAQARDRGLLWRVTKGGHASYLYGTLHVGRAEWMAPGPSVQRALQETDTVALELDPLDETVQREMAAGMAHAKAYPLPAALQSRLLRALQAQCLPADATSQAAPEMLVYTLSTLVGRPDGLEPSFGSEILLSILAHGSGRPVVSLETVALQLKTLLARNAAEAETVVREGLDDLDSDRVHTVLLKSAQVWENGELAELERYSQWCQCANTPLDKKLMRRLLDDRNPGLAQRIDQLHAQGHKLFVAVGAMHMTGAIGIPALLARRGYQVERVF